MTRIIHETPVIFETNGDCSAITLNFVIEPEYEKLVDELREKLEAQGFRIQRVGVRPNMIRILAPAVKLECK